jgi:hypothetical protein
VDKIPTEDKILLSAEEEAFGLEPWEIQGIVQSALNHLPEGLDEYVDILFDTIYEAVSEALEQARG